MGLPKRIPLLSHLTWEIDYTYNFGHVQAQFCEHFDAGIFLELCLLGHFVSSVFTSVCLIGVTQVLSV